MSTPQQPGQQPYAHQPQAPAQQPYPPAQQAPQQPYGAPQQAPQQPYGAPQQQPYGAAPQQQPYGAAPQQQYPGHQQAQPTAQQAQPVQQSASTSAQPSYPGAQAADANAAYTGGYAPAAPAQSGSSPLVLIGLILLGVSLLAGLVTPMIYPIMIRGGVLDGVGVLSFVLTIVHLLLFAGALVCGILALRRRQRPVLAAMLVGAAGISLASALLGTLSSYLLTPLFYAF